MKNAGKIFERDFQLSAPDYCFVYRLNDPAQSMQKTALRFSLKNPCDFFVFNDNDGKLYALELKTTKNKSISFESIDPSENSSGRMIHRHQIIGLKKMSGYKNIIAGFILNYRNEINNEQATYFISINNFEKLYYDIGKWSFTENDLLEFGAIKLEGHKKKTHYVWEYESFLV